MLNLEKIKNFFSDYHNIILVAILLFSFIVRLYFLIQTSSQPLWWDEAQYAEEARRIGLGLETNDIWYYRRTILLPIIWASLFFAGLGETSLRFSEIIFSVLLVFTTYLLGKELFNKDVGLGSSLVMSFSRIILFESTRLLNSIPAAAFMTLAAYYFYKGYMKDYKPKYLYLFGLFAGIAMNLRFATFLALISFVVIFLIKEKFKFWNNKHVIGSFLLILIILSPFFILYQKHYSEGIKDFLRHYGEVGVKKEEKQPYLGVTGLWLYIKEIPNNISWFMFIMFIIGCVFLLDFFIAPDLIFKDLNLQKNLFLFLFILPPLIYHGFKSLYVEDRYLIGILPVIAIIAGYGLFKSYKYLKNYNKYLALSMISVLLLISTFTQISDAKEAIYSKRDSYQQIKDASLFIKENSKTGDIVISNSIPQMQYYTDRSVYYIEDANEVDKLKPKFYVISIYEKSADSYYEYPEKNKEKLKVVQVYFLDEQQTRPSLIIYEFL